MRSPWPDKGLNQLLKLGKLLPQCTSVLEKFLWRLGATGITEQEKV
ncbi:MAG: hypothetical protein V7L25_25675 [Nostoc sp.]